MGVPVTMSKTTIALEAAVAAVLENMPKGEERGTARQRAAVDRAFMQIMKLIAPRVRHFIRQYGLTAHWDDAEQCCAIAVHRAIQAYEPEKAQFTTFVNWQIRGELQSLRFRLMTDQRPSAKKVDATTVSLHSVATGPEGEETTLEAIVVDEEALALTEAAASDYLATSATRSLLDEFVRSGRNAGIEALRRQQPKRAIAKARIEGPRLKSALAGIDPAAVEALDQKLARDREILERRVFGDAGDDVDLDAGVTKERIRQISKRAARTMAELAAAQPRFQVMADYAPIAAAPKRASRSVAQAPVGLLADPASRHNREIRVVDVQPGASPQRAPYAPAHATPVPPVAHPAQPGLSA